MCINDMFPVSTETTMNDNNGKGANEEKKDGMSMDLILFIVIGILCI